MRSGEGAALMSDGSANLMVPHAENRMAPLNAKTILIIDELGTSGEESNKEKGSATNNERTNATQRAIVFELHSLKQSG